MRLNKGLLKQSVKYGGYYEKNTICDKGKGR